MALTEKIIAIADKTRELTGLTNKMTLEEIPSNMNLIKTKPNLQDKTIEITENGTTNIKADEGFDGLNNVDITVNVEGGSNEKEYLYLIKDGVEQTDVTGGYTLKGLYGGTGNNTVFQGDGFLGLCSQIWSYWTLTFNNEIDFAKYPKLYIEYAYPQTSTPYAYNNIEFRLQTVDTKLIHTFINKTGVKERTLVEIDFSQSAIIEQLRIDFANTGDSSSYTNYPIQLFNLYFEKTPIPLQNKSIEITQNGVTNVKCDEGYTGLNKVEVITNVEGSGSSSEIFSTEEVMTNKNWIDGKPIYRKVFTSTLPDASNYSSYAIKDIDISNLNCDTPIEVYGMIDQDNSYAHWTLNWYNHTATASVITHIILFSNVIRVRHNCNWLNKQPFILVFEYTKK